MQITKHLVKSIATPLAQSTTLLHVHSGSFASQIDIASGYIANKKNNIIDRVVIQLLMSNGLRISEVLHISGSDITPDGSILIRSKKGSELRYVSAMQFSSWLGNNRLFFASQVAYRNRWYYYRLFKRIGLDMRISGNSNNAVTHLFRYAFIERVNQLSGSSESTAKIVGHKNPANTKRYLNKSKNDGKKK